MVDSYSLLWEEYADSFGLCLKEAYDQVEFTDVTLVSDDDKQLKAHKFILSSCSPVFWKILVNNHHQHPLIYLTGVKHEEVRSMIRFMYLGHTEVAQENFDHFMKLARRFKIKGLTQHEIEDEQVHDDSKDNSIPDSKVDTLEEIANENHEMEVQAKVSVTSVDTNIENLDQSNECDLSCKECNFKATSKKNLKHHVEAQHFVPWFTCNNCDFQSRRSDSLKVHKENRH